MSLTIRGIFRVVGSLLLVSTGTTTTHFELKSPLHYLDFIESETRLSTAHRHHLHDDHHQTGRFCSCGKCSLISQFQHSCPVAYSESQSPISRSVQMSYYVFSTGNLVQQSLDGLPITSALSQESNSDLHLLPQCFRSKGAHSCTYLQDDCCIMDLFHVNKTVSFKTFDTDEETLKLRSLLQVHSVRPLTCNHFIERPSCPFQVVVRIRRYLTLKSARNKGGNVGDPRGAANFFLLLLLLAGDVESNPGPSVMLKQILKQLSDNIETSGLHTHRAIIKSVYTSLLPESQASSTRRTLETLYDGLCASARYHDYSHCIINYIIVELLRLDVKGDEKRVLVEQANLQANDVLELREIKFIQLLAYLSYTTKEILVEAKLLPKSIKTSKEDTAEIISNLVQSGDLKPTSKCLQKLLKSVTSDSLGEQIKVVLDSPEWVDADHVLKANVTMKTLKSSRQADIVEPDSPKSQDLNVIGALSQDHEQLHVAPPTIQDLATFPELGDAWEDFGRALFIDDKTLQSIKYKFPTSVRKQKELFRAYLKTCLSPNWADIINALVLIGKEGMARQAIDVLELPQELLATARKFINSGSTSASVRVSKTEILSAKSSCLPGSDKSLPKPRIVSDDGAAPPASQIDQVEQLSSPLPAKSKTALIPVRSDFIDGRQAFSGNISVSDRESNKDKQSSENISLSSDDFHSAEETPLDDNENTTDGHSQLTAQSHFSHQSSIKKLHDAVMSRNAEGIHQCIDQDITTLNAPLEIKSGQTALHITARLGFKDIAKFLLQLKASVTVKDSNGCTPLYLAASCGNYEIAKMIIASPDCDVNVKSKDGTPPLYDPASKGFSMICELLLENGANPLTDTRTGVSPLYIASKNGHKDVVKILLKFEADVTQVCVETSKTPLQEAIDNEHIEVVKLLMKALSEINKKNERLFECKTAERVHELVKHGANVDFRKANGSTPIIVHAAAGNKEVVQALIEEKANVDIQDNDGWSALMVASQSGYIEIVRSLIYAGTIPDLKNKEGLTALMCATLAAHMTVIKELLLAKADPVLKRRDGRSALEIAEQYGNKEIITALRRHTTTASPGNDPLYSLLGSYLELKKVNASEKQAMKNGDKASHDHMTLTVKRRESLSSLLPKPPASTADDTSTAKQELEKCYKRIADLETRIHDLTLQNSIEVPVEIDLAYLERRRLEDEYSKLKELKRKAEQYAVEAKQTAQRLSAENSKLREDLSKERHHNEITRNNIIREFEQKAGHDTGTMGGEKLAAKMEVLNQEIQDRAYQLLRRMPQEKGSVRRVELKAVAIKEVVLEKCISIKCLGLAVMGLPSSGKTEFLHQMLELKVDLGARGSSVLDIHEAVLCHDQFNDSHTLIKSSREDCSVQPISVALAKTLVCMHKTPSLSSSMSSLVDPNNIVEEFPDLNVNRHFKAILENVQKVALQLESTGSLDMLMTGSLSIFNLANTEVGKVAYDISCALASRCENLVIPNLLNLERDLPEKFISSIDGEQSKYAVTKPESALVHYMDAAFIASRNCKGKRVILVGTHKDKLNQGKLKETKKNLEKITMGYAESIGVAGAICPGMECINAKDFDDCQRLQKRIIELINILENFQYNIPIRYLFLLSYLQNLNQMFISRRKLVEIARTCGVIDEDEIEEFLIIFNSCGSLIYSSGDEIPTLKDYIILNPFNFIKELDKLNQITTMSFSDKLELFEEVDDTRLGFISERMARYLWPGEGDGKMTQAHFFLTFFKELKVILPSNALQLETNIRKTGKGKFYYMPILRADQDSAELKGDSSSLIISHNNAVVPFRLQTDVIFQIQNHFGTTVTFDPKPHYNTICFKWHESSRDQCEANIIIRFNTEHIEVSVLFPNQVPHLSTVTRIYSQLKTACVQIFQVLSAEIKRLNYEFAFVCPHSSDTPSQSHADMYSTHVHFIQFHPLRAGEKNFFCQSCQKRIPSDNLPWAKLLWTQVAYQGPIRDEGCLTNERIVMLCQSLVSRLDLHTINLFAKQLKFSKEEAIPSHPLMPLESLLHFLIFTWRSRHPVNSIESLAKILHSCGCYQEAIQLDPLLLHDSMKSIQGHEISLSLTDFEWSSIAAYLPQSTMKLLVSSTDPKSKATGSPDGTSSRETVIHKLRELEYHSLAVALEIGWFL